MSRRLPKPRVIFTALVLVCLYAPILLVLVFSVNKDPQLLRWEGFTLDWYREAFHDEAVRDELRDQRAGRHALHRDLAGARRHRRALGAAARTRRARACLDATTYMRIILPEIVCALGLFLLLRALDVELGVGAIIIGHVVFNSAYATIIIQARLATLTDDAGGGRGRPRRDAAGACSGASRCR